MARNPAPPAANGGIGDNFNLSAKDLATIEKLTREIKSFESERSAINDSISERRSTIKAMGIDMDAWRSAKRRMEMDPDDRTNFDRSQAMCNTALGVPLQADLFAAPAAASGAGLPSDLH